MNQQGLKITTKTVDFRFLVLNHRIEHMENLHLSYICHQIQSALDMTRPNTTPYCTKYIDGLVQDPSKSSALAELTQNSDMIYSTQKCTKKGLNRSRTRFI